jgi:hypothetical protein
VCNLSDGIGRTSTFVVVVSRLTMDRPWVAMVACIARAVGKSGTRDSPRFSAQHLVFMIAITQNDERLTTTTTDGAQRTVTPPWRQNNMFGATLMDFDQLTREAVFEALCSHPDDRATFEQAKSRIASRGHHSERRRAAVAAVGDGRPPGEGTSLSKWPTRLSETAGGPRLATSTAWRSGGKRRRATRRSRERGLEHLAAGT